MPPVEHPQATATRADPRPGGRVSMEERRRQIRALVTAHEHCSVAELATRFATSAVTIRSDLAALEAAGGVMRTHGGVLAARDGDEIPLSRKKTLHLAEKMRIAQAAASLIQSGDIVILDYMLGAEEGVTFARWLRNDPESPAPYTPIILLTGHADRPKIMAARDAGVRRRCRWGAGRRPCYGQGPCGGFDRSRRAGSSRVDSRGAARVTAGARR